MLSMEPSIKRGLTFWDRALLPADEFAERVGLIRAEMRRQGLDALIVAGNMYDDAELIYIVGGNVDGTLLLTLEGEPLIFAASGSREVFFLRHLSWIEAMSHEGPLIGKAMRAALERRQIPRGRIGTAGLQIMTSRAYRDLSDALSAYEMKDFSPAFAAIRRRLRPREMLALRMALGINQAAAAAADRAFAGGASNAAATIEAERIARLQGAWDFRALANLDSDELRPFERVSGDRRTPLLLWLASRYQGYWADGAAASGATPGSEAARCLAAMIASARAGVPARQVAAAGLSCLSPAAQASALAYGLGEGIGASLNGRPVIAPDSAEPLAEGAVVSLRAFAAGARPSLAAAMVEIGAQGANAIEPLARSMLP